MFRQYYSSFKLTMKRIPYYKLFSIFSCCIGALLIWLGCHFFYGYTSGHMLWLCILPATTLVFYIVIGLGLIISGGNFLRKTNYYCITYKFTCIVCIFFALDQLISEKFMYGNYLPYWSSFLIIAISAGVYYYFSKIDINKKNHIKITITAFLLSLLINVFFFNYTYI